MSYVTTDNTEKISEYRDKQMQEIGPGQGKIKNSMNKRIDIWQYEKY